jgi:hypothetical protein
MRIMRARWWSTAGRNTLPVALTLISWRISSQNLPEDGLTPTDAAHGTALVDADPDTDGDPPTVLDADSQESSRPLLDSRAPSPLDSLPPTPVAPEDGGGTGRFERFRSIASFIVWLRARGVDAQALHDNRGLEKAPFHASDLDLVRIDDATYVCFASKRQSDRIGFHEEWRELVAFATDLGSDADIPVDVVYFNVR